MVTGKGSTDVTNTIETNRLVVGNTVTELADMSEVFVDICLVLTLPFVWEDLQKRLTTSLVILLCKKECPETHRKRSHHFVITIDAMSSEACLILSYQILIV